MFGVSQTFPHPRVCVVGTKWHDTVTMELTYKTGENATQLEKNNNHRFNERFRGSDEKRRSYVRLIRKDEIHSTNKPDFSWGGEGARRTTARLGLRSPLSSIVSRLWIHRHRFNCISTSLVYISFLLSFSLSLPPPLSPFFRIFSIFNNIK